MPAFGQIPTTQLPEEHFKDSTNFWYKWTSKQERKLDLKPIERSVHPFHLRLSVHERILDVWQQDSLFQGTLTMWVKDADELLQTVERIHYEQYKLSPQQAASIGQLIRKSEIIKLPSEEQIPGWQKGCDGEEIIVQYVAQGCYHFKNYWTPSAQRGLAEALVVQQFFTNSFDQANWAVVSKAFNAGIPFRCYTNGAFVTCKIVSTTEYWQLKREVNRYLRQAKKSSK